MVILITTGIGTKYKNHSTNLEREIEVGRKREGERERERERNRERGERLDWLWGLIYLTICSQKGLVRECGL